MPNVMCISTSLQSVKKSNEAGIVYYAIIFFVSTELFEMHAKYSHRKQCQNEVVKIWDLDRPLKAFCV